MITTRQIRIVGSLAAAIMISPLMILGYCVAEADRTHQWAAVLVLLSASAILWIGGVAVSTAIHRYRRQSAKLWHCLLLGTFCAFTTPLFGITIAQVVARWFLDGTSGKGEKFPLSASLLGGLFTLPSALLAGWIVWRWVFPEAMKNQQTLTARHAGDLRGLRLVLALTASAVLPAVVLFIVCVAFLYGADVPAAEAVAPEQALILCGWVFATSAAWFVLGGFVLLHALTRRHGLIDRATCLAVGATVAMLLPFASVWIGLDAGRVIEPLWDVVVLFAPETLVQNAAFYAMVGGLLLPFGVPGAWLLWYIAVRPAPAPVTSTTPSVFD